MIQTPRLYIKDPNDKLLTTIDREYFDDELQRYLTGKATIFTFKVYKDDLAYNDIVAGCKVAFEYKDEDFWLNIMRVEQDETIMEFEAWSLNFELNNELKAAYSAPKAMTFEEYVNVFNTEDAFEIGINEVFEKKIKYEWTGSEGTFLSRMLSLASVFDAEIEFQTVNDQFHNLEKIVLNIYRKHSETYQGLGTDQRKQVFRYGDEIATISKKEDASELYSAIRPKGKDDLTINGYKKTEYDENGLIQFFTDGDMIFAPQSKERYPSTITEHGNYIVYVWETEYATKESLYGNALAKLKELCVPKIEWEIEGYLEVNIGDTVTIANDGYTPTLYLEARVAEQTISFTNPDNNKTTFTNVIEVGSEISNDLLAKMQELIEANKQYAATIVSDNGIVFKNGIGETNIAAVIRDGVRVVTDNFEIHWFKDDKEIYIGNSLHVKSSDVQVKNVYKFEARTIIEQEVKASYEITIINVSDGKDGENGSNGVGIKSINQTWQLSDSGTEKPIGEWLSEMPAIPQGKYLWAKTTQIMTDDSKNENYLVTYSSKDGTNGENGSNGKPTGVTVSEIFPENPYDGMLWKNTGSENGYLYGQTYIWNQSENVWEIDTITADSFIAKTFKGFTIEGSEFISSFDRPVVNGSPDNIRGAVTIKDGVMSIDSEVYNRETNVISSFNKDFIQAGNIQGSARGTDGNSTKSYALSAGGLVLTDVVNGYFGSISAAQLAKVAWENIPLANGFTSAEGAIPQYRRVQMIDGSYEMQLRGKVAPTSGNYNPGTGYVITKLSYKPFMKELFMCGGNGGRTMRLQTETDGQITIMTADSGTNYISLSGIRYECS